jgi:hypothetical protein
MEAEATLGPHVGDTERRRLINKYIGDFTLFWTGVYPENLHAEQRTGADRLREYLLQGRRSYAIASELTRREDLPPADVLQHLSEEFECCVHALHLVREGWEQLTDGPESN